MNVTWAAAPAAEPSLITAEAPPVVSASFPRPWTPSTVAVRKPAAAKRRAKIFGWNKGSSPRTRIAGDGPGFVNVPALKGIHYAIETGALAAEAAFAVLQRGEAVGRRGALASYDEAVKQSFVWRDLEQVRNMRQAFGRGFWLGGALAGAMTASHGKFPPGDARTEPDAEQELIRTGRARRYPAPDGKLTFDKLSSVFLSGNKTRDDAPNHLRIQTRVAPELAELWARMCPAQVYEPQDGRVEVTASNCVQCGAITAKGGRLTPPEGGSGPEYSVT